MGRKSFFNMPCDCTPSDPIGVIHLLVGFDGGNRVGECEKCKKRNLKALPERTINLKKQGWPYYNASLGVSFESESHEQKYVKANNLSKRE